MGLYILLFLIAFVVYLPVAESIKLKRMDAFADAMEREIVARGGRVLRQEAPMHDPGPFRRSGRGSRIIKVVYQDAAGTVRQCWGDRSLGGGDKLRWDYDDTGRQIL